MFIDTHCHLTFPNFKEDLDDVITRAEAADVRKIIVPGMDLHTSREAVQLADQYVAVYAAVGVHPQESRSFNPDHMKEFEGLASHPKVVAVGEIGLDFYRDYAPHDLQKSVFRNFLNFAGHRRLPVIIHNRAAYDDILKIVREAEFREVSGVFHCFSEDERGADEVMDLGYAVSFTGTVTFKNSKTAEISRSTPLDKQLLETDAPFMAPAPFRGKRNEPAYVKHIAEKQAELRAITPGEVGRITTEHAYHIFPRLRN